MGMCAEGRCTPAFTAQHTACDGARPTCLRGGSCLWNMRDGRECSDARSLSAPPPEALWHRCRLTAALSSSRLLSLYALASLSVRTLPARLTFSPSQPHAKACPPAPSLLPLIAIPTGEFPRATPAPRTNSHLTFTCFPSPVLPNENHRCNPHSRISHRPQAHARSLADHGAPVPFRGKEKVVPSSAKDSPSAPLSPLPQRELSSPHKKN